MVYYNRNNEDQTDKRFLATSCSELTEWSEPYISNYTAHADVTNFIWVNPALVKLIRQKLRRRGLKLLDHYLYFCSTIQYLKHIDRRFENCEYVPVNRHIMSSIINKRKYDEIVNNLIGWGIIQCNDSYQANTTSKGYKLLQPYSHHVKKRPIKDKCINMKINAHKNKSYNEIKKLPYAYQYLAVTNTMIEMDYTSAITYNKSKYFDSGKITKYESNLYSVSSYSDKEYRFVVDSFASRAHSNLTNLKSDMRQFLSVDGDQLSQIDIKNSQPLFFYLHIKDNPEITDDEKERYKLLVEGGRFYEFFMEKLDIPASQRNQVKKKIIPAIFFDRYRTDEGRYMKVFREAFPSIAEYLVEIRRKDHRRLAQILQKAESKFIIEKVVAAFVRKCGPQYEFISTIHDSIVVKRDMLPEASKILSQCFQEENINPQVSIVHF